MNLETTQDPLDHLPRDAYYHLVFTLRATLPPATDQPEALAWRDHAAIAQVAALCPANAAEAALAAQYVAANAQAMACLQLARDPTLTPEWLLRCTAQGAAMMRQAQGAFRLLVRTQADRRKLESSAQAADQAAWAEHIAAAWMTQGMDAIPEREPEPPPDAPPGNPAQKPRQNPTQHHPETRPAKPRPTPRPRTTVPGPAPPFPAQVLPLQA